MRSPLMKTLLAASVTAAAAVLGVAAAGPASADPLSPRRALTTTSTGSYVALGDSYSSGESVAPYAWNSNTAINHCHRSTAGYPALLAKTLSNGMTFDFDACSGAITADLYQPNHSGNKVTVDLLEPAQLQHLDRYTRTVTLTIGGNDIGFSQIMGACLYNDQQRATRTDCSTGPVRPLVEARIAALDGVKNGATTPSGAAITPISTIVADIRARSPKAAIYLGTYPYLVSSGFSGSECTVGGLAVKEAPGQKMPLYLSKTDATWMTSAVTSLDSVIRVAGTKAGIPVRVAEARDRFRYHGLCDADAAWITPVSGTVSAATGAVDIDAGSMHPTADGQKAYADTFYRAS